MKVVTSIIFFTWIIDVLANTTPPILFRPRTNEVIPCDVAIIGGGSAGTYAAIAITDKKKRVVVLEQRARLGGHTETYTDKGTGTAVDYGVQIWHNSSTVLNYFKRLNVSLTAVATGASPKVAHYDLQNGVEVNATLPEPVAVNVALHKYADFLKRYPTLDDGMFLPKPLPEDLVMAFGDFAKKYKLEAVVRTMFDLNPGIGDLLSAPVVEHARLFGLSLVDQILSDSLVTTTLHNNSELYGNAQTNLLSSRSLLLSSNILECTRTKDSVRVLVATPNGVKIVIAKRLLITIPPRPELLRAFDLSRQEKDVLDQFVNTGYYTSLIGDTGIPDDVSIYNYALNNPYNLPNLSSIYSIYATALPGVKTVYYGTPRSTSAFPLNDAEVQASIIDSIKRLQRANPTRFLNTEPKVIAYSSHSPFYLQVKSKAIKDGFYEKLYGLQGLQNTFWSGASFRAQDSSLIWRYTEREVLPKLLKDL
jgi:hypothetical protein